MVEVFSGLQDSDVDVFVVGDGLALELAEYLVVVDLQDMGHEAPADLPFGLALLVGVEDVLIRALEEVLVDGILLRDLLEYDPLLGDRPLPFETVLGRLLLLLVLDLEPLHLVFQPLLLEALLELGEVLGVEALQLRLVHLGLLVEEGPNLLFGQHQRREQDLLIYAVRNSPN